MLKIANSVVPTCTSTNDLAKDLILKGYDHGTWVSSLQQTTGRGRLGRQWASCDGNLFLSMITSISRKNHWTWIPLVAGIAVTDAMETLFGKNEILMKWPNDLYFERRKLGGILCEGIQGKVIVGIGLNCKKVPEEFSKDATSLRDVFSLKNVNLDQVRTEVIKNLLDWFRYLENGLIQEKIKPLYEKRSLFKSGDRVQWFEKEEIAQGRVLGIGESGQLQVELNNHEIRDLFAEEVTEFRLL